MRNLHSGMSHWFNSWNREEQVMSWKKIYAIYVTEVLLYLLLHAAQIRKGLFSPAVFTGILAVLFLWAVVFLLLFLVRKIRKKEGWKRREILFLHCYDKAIIMTG